MFWALALTSAGSPDRRFFICTWAPWHCTQRCSSIGAMGTVAKRASAHGCAVGAVSFGARPQSRRQSRPRPAPPRARGCRPPWCQAALHKTDGSAPGEHEHNSSTSLCAWAYKAVVVAEHGQDHRQREIRVVHAALLTALAVQGQRLGVRAGPPVMAATTLRWPGDDPEKRALMAVASMAPTSK